MSRKKRPAAEPAAAPTPTHLTEAATATVEPPQGEPNPVPQTREDAAPPTDGTGKHYGPPYKAVFTSNEKAFELGENRRFKQRVFTFKERPADDVIAALKDAGFTYRAAEKAWTVPATAESRVLSDRLARQFAGVESSMSRG